MATPASKFSEEELSRHIGTDEFRRIQCEVPEYKPKPMRFAERGDYDAFFSEYNEGWSASQQR